MTMTGEIIYSCFLRGINKFKIKIPVHFIHAANVQIRSQCHRYLKLMNNFRQILTIEIKI